MKQPTHQELLDARVHFGHLASKWHPTFAPYIFGKHNGIHIIDLDQTLQQLDRVTKDLQALIGSGKKVLFVATKEQAATRIEQMANNLSQPFVTKRWLGGTLTNFTTVRKNLKNLVKLEEMLEGPNSQKLTKQERLTKMRKKEKLEVLLAGISHITRPPAALFVVDAKRENMAVREAKTLGIPVFAIADTDTPIAGIETGTIPSNDDASTSINLLLDYIEAQLIESSRTWEEERSKKEAHSPTIAKVTTKATPPRRTIVAKVASSTSSNDKAPVTHPEPTA